MNNTIWLFNIATAIEIDALPFLKMGFDFPWRTVSHNQMVYHISYVSHNQMVYHNQRVTVSNGTLQ